MSIENGRKIPLFTDEELAKARKHRRKKKNPPVQTPQPSFLDEEVHVSGILGPITIIDPEKGIARRHHDSQYPIEWAKDKLLSKEIQQKKQELRNRIGLPVARGKDEHVNDDFYKFLVKNVVKFDTFEIFCEFDRVITETPPELDLKIGEVSGLVGELLKGGLNGQERYQRFYQFRREYRKSWEK